MLVDTLNKKETQVGALSEYCLTSIYFIVKIVKEREDWAQISSHSGAGLMVGWGQKMIYLICVQSGLMRSL